MSSFAGCAAKYSPKDLSILMENIKDYNSVSNNDDAAVIECNRTLLQTVDIISPIVSDYYAFGQIASVHSMSDIYAMGGKPYCAMNIVAFPELNTFNSNGLKAILEGGKDKLIEANCLLAGGHTVVNNDIKYGLSVTGIAGKNITYNSNLQEGNLLILTKPLGIGILVSAIKVGLGDKDKIEKEIIRICTQLNNSDVIQKFDIKAATDITGFGLGGHLIEMARASNVSIELYSEEIVPAKYVAMYIDLENNRMYENIQFNKQYCDIKNDEFVNLIFDPQTSGGLVLAVSKDKIKDVKTLC